MNPSILLLDEPLGALDLKLREQMKIELKKNRSNPVSTASRPLMNERLNTLTKFSRVGVKMNFGGIASASLWVLNAVSTIHRTGMK